MELATFAFRPRESLMWPPRRRDVRRIASWGSRFVDYGAGSGLLAQLLREEGARVDAFEPNADARRFGPFVDSVTPPYDVAIVSWMEAGADYREEVARLGPLIVNVYDIEGGCGIKGQVEFAGWSVLDSWRTPSFEDAAFALQRKGRGLTRKGWPGNRIDVLSRTPRPLPPSPTPLAAYSWEREMDEAGL